jgi:hypothetical protein
LGWAEPSYTDSVDLIGEVRATDLDGLKFTMRVQGGRKITGRFKPEQETLVLEALGEHFSRRMRVTGVGQFAREDGTLKQVIDVEQIELIEPHEAVPEQTVPIWDQLASVGTGVPQDAWKDVPADFSTNVDSYLYGGRKDRL